MASIATGRGKNKKRVSVVRGYNLGRSGRDQSKVSKAKRKGCKNLKKAARGLA